MADGTLLRSELPLRLVEPEGNGDKARRVKVKGGDRETGCRPSGTEAAGPVVWFSDLVSRNLNHDLIDRVQRPFIAPCA